MIISVTERGTFRRCRRRWDYSSYNRQGLEPIINKPALTVGSLIHATLADWMVDPIGTDPEATYLSYAAKEMQNIRTLYKLRVGAPVSEDELADVYDQVQIGQSMVKNYVEFWGGPLPEDFRLIQPEQTCLIRIPHTRNGWLEGTLDGLVQDVKTGLIYVLERKTYSQRPRMESLQSNDQFLTYCWIITQLNLGELGGVLYDGLWKRDGSSKRHEMSDLFLRTTLLRSQYEIDELQSNLISEYRDMLHPSIYPSRRWEGCFDCPFDRLCLTQSRGEDVDYVRETYYKPRDPNRRITGPEGESD